MIELLDLSPVHRMEAKTRQKDPEKENLLQFGYSFSIRHVHSPSLTNDTTPTIRLNQSTSEPCDAPTTTFVSTAIAARGQSKYRRQLIIELGGRNDQP